ncbi:MAG: tRNA (guanosine(46)-N7)-methyltransferase TrmB [Clostridiales bacterium]|nr:tRNA (guanosine(46)-N7)-methyltransferase TrmB [Clostridiales bacterium]
MRQRRVTQANEKIAAYVDLLLPAEEETGLRVERPSHHLRWYERPSSRYLLPAGFPRTYVELGCGRGQFINTLAAADPEALYIGVEGCKSILLSALKKTRETNLANVLYIDAFINDATTAFDEASIAGIFLNFSDPWPKERHASRRLTAQKKAEAYFHILDPGGFAAVKTDGEALYNYSLRTFTEAGFCITSTSDPIATRAISTPTEYEERFRVLGMPIYHFIALKP